MFVDAVMDTAFFLDQQMTAAEHCPVGKAHALVYSSRSPDKTTPNEDAAAVITIDETRAVLAVADGLGGQPEGAKAAMLALQALDDAIRSRLNGAELREAVLNGFENANRDVSGLGVGAGTTLAAVEIQGRTVRPYHVGDSSIIVVGQRGKIKLQTVAHSPVGYAVEAGLLGEAEAMHHEDRHIVSNMVGSPDMRIEIGPTLELRPRDTLIIASDGLADNLHAREIVDMIRTGPLDRAAEQLASACARRMRGVQNGRPSKPDDLTFVIYRPA